MIEWLKRVFNVSMNVARIPEGWRKSRNYRGIRLLSTPRKIHERVITVA